MYKEIIEKIRPDLDKAIAFLDSELAKIRTGRATPALVENVACECFGQYFPLKQLATISIPEPKQILIQPWDSSYIDGIAKALSKTGVGANPIVDREGIRINLPPLSEEYRKELLRLVSQKQEETKKTIRKWRDRAWDEIQEKARKGEIREDDKYRGKDELQKLVDEYNEKIEEMIEKKKKEILE